VIGFRGMSVAPRAINSGAVAHLTDYTRRLA
jgi:hypothetical protein